MCRSVRIEGRATPIIETSRASRKRAAQSTIRAPQARRLNRSAPPSSGGESVRVDTSFGSFGVSVGQVRYCSTAIVHQLFDARQTMLQSGEQTRVSDLSEVDVLTVLQALSDPVRLE